MKAHCLFEQSGTFKNEFKKFGFEAYDYDILDDFGETDFVVDLFAEIERAYEGGRASSTKLNRTTWSWRFFRAFVSRLTFRCISPELTRIKRSGTIRKN